MGSFKTILGYFFAVRSLLASSCAAKHDVVQDIPLPVGFEQEDLSSGTGSSATSSDAQLFFLVQSKGIQKAIDALFAAKERDPYLYHSKILEKLALYLLQEGMNSNNPKDALLSLYGIGLSLNEDAISLIKKAINSHEGELQLAAIEVLKAYNSDEANVLLIDALKSDYLLIRLEAAFALASKRTASAYPQIEALFMKVEPEFRAYFPELFALDGSPDSMNMLKRLFRDHDQEVRLACVHAMRMLRRDDFIQEIKNQAEDPSSALQEAAACALGEFHDSSTRKLLEELMQRDTFTRLASAKALYILGDEAAKKIIVDEAEKDNLFAITLLGSTHTSKTFLRRQMENQSQQVRLNATIALLEQKDASALEGLFPIFIQRQNDLAFQSIASPGKALTSYKATPSAFENLKSTPFLYEVSLRLREELLVKTLELQEDDFLEVARLIFHCQQHDLIPLLVRLLENLRSKKAVELLQYESERLGSPFIRAYANLALFRMNEAGPYSERVLEWVRKNDSFNLIETRQILPWNVCREKSNYSLTLEEKSRLLVESFESLALSHRDEAISALLLAIRDGNPHNRYLLAGLLARAAQ